MSRAAAHRRAARKAPTQQRSGARSPLALPAAAEAHAATAEVPPEAPALTPTEAIAPTTAMEIAEPVLAGAASDDGSTRADLPRDGRAHRPPLSWRAAGVAARSCRRQERIRANHAAGLFQGRAQRRRRGLQGWPPQAPRLVPRPPYRPFVAFDPHISTTEGREPNAEVAHGEAVQVPGAATRDLLGLGSEKPGELPLEAKPRVVLDDALADCIGYLVAA